MKSFRKKFLAIKYRNMAPLKQAMPETGINGEYNGGVKISDIEKVVKLAAKTEEGKKLLREACAKLPKLKKGRPKKLVRCPKCKKLFTASTLKSYRKCPHTEDTVTPRS